MGVVGASEPSPEPAGNKSEDREIERFRVPEHPRHALRGRETRLRSKGTVRHHQPRSVSHSFWSNCSATTRCGGVSQDLTGSGRFEGLGTPPVFARMFAPLDAVPD